MVPKTAPQTLLVPDAPRDLALQRPIPLPFVTLEPAIALPDPILPNPPPAPKANILSLPDQPVQAATTLLVPKVNQSAGGGPSTQSQSGAPSEPSVSLNTEPRPSGSGSPSDAEMANVTRLDLPPDGQFPASVLGPSISEQYPDINTGLSGKVVSTVYLKVGFQKSWALEFWAAGSPPDAPWPYEIYRPENLDMPPEAEAVLISGRINENGRFENLQLLLPPEWPQKDSLFRALQHWKFRPAMRNGIPISVDVLLSIPQNAENE
jgi:hypothetical protein